jgi:glycosyltransferase involved in cell wall biosynthesis
VYVQHSSFQDQQAFVLRRHLRHILFRFLFMQVDIILRVCKNALPDKWAPGRILTVYNGVKLEHFPCRSTWRRSPDEPFTMLMVGAVNANKNQRLAIEALALLPQGNLVVVGQGPERSALEGLATDLGVEKRVHWEGFQDDTSRFYREADVYLMLSTFEAMPFAVLESMASGTPVVGFPVGGVGEIIENQVDGILLPVKSAEALVRTLIPLMEEPFRLRDMGWRARMKIETHFTAEQMATGFLKSITAARERRTKRAE